MQMLYGTRMQMLCATQVIDDTRRELQRSTQRQDTASSRLIRCARGASKVRLEGMAGCLCNCFSKFENSKDFILQRAQAFVRKV
eukprot:746852-Hanusia_phi.AAC.1